MTYEAFDMTRDATETEAAFIADAKARDGLVVVSLKIRSSDGIGFEETVVECSAPIHCLNDFPSFRRNYLEAAVAGAMQHVKDPRKRHPQPPVEHVALNGNGA